MDIYILLLKKEPLNKKFDIVLNIQQYPSTIQ